MESAKKNTRHVYEDHAATWDEQRPRHLYERKWLDHFANTLPQSGSILDLGCGAGEPVSQYLIAHGFQITGIDFSQPMIDLAVTRFPEQTWLAQDMRSLKLAQRFDGIISWDGFFHLSQSEQRLFLGKLPSLLNNSATLLFTIGTGDGEVTGTVAGQTVYHASLEPDEYQDILIEHGFKQIETVLEDEDALGRSVLFATR